MTQQPEHVEDPWITELAATEGFPVASQRRSGNGSGKGNGGGNGHQDRHDRGPENGAPGGFERVPPQDLEAEKSVLGGMLLSKDAIADVVEVLKGQDFYRPAHETVYQAILDLYAKGEPADPITVTAELTKRGEIARVGGPGYVQSLVQAVPTAANAEYYAEIVHERAVLRRLVEAGTRITQMGYAADGDVDDIVNSAQSEIYAVTEQRTSEDYLPLGDIMEGALDEIEAIGSRSGQMTGVPTGFTDLDSLTNGLHPGQMIVIAARPAMGKALALDTPLPTPDGWTTMGEVDEGDFLLDAQGNPTRVVAATEIMTERPCFEVVFDDGTTVTADAGHQWVTADGVTLTTAESARRLSASDAVPLRLHDGPGAVPHAMSQVRETRSVPVRCVQVDNPDHLYLATRSMVPTHNSTLALDFARACSIKHNMPSVIFSLEMGRNEIAMRLLSAEARVALHHMRSGSMTDEDWTRLARQMPGVTDAPLYIDDSPNLSMMEIRAKCRRLKQRNDLQLIVIDYLQLMQSGGSRRPESRQQEVSEMSRNLKLLAKELEVPVIALSQLNRGPEQRTDKKPMVSDLRESGSIEQDADMVILLHREDAYEKESPRAGEADLIVAKHRNGPTATITVAFQGHYSRFVDMAQT